MKTGLFAIIVIAGAINIAHGAGPFVIDDFEDGDPVTTKLGWWFTYTDAASGGNSTVDPPNGRFAVSAGRLTVKILYMSDSCDHANQSCATLTDWADFEAALTGKLTREWMTVKLDLHKDFKQPAWTKTGTKFPIEKVLENARGLQWYFSSPDGDSVDVSIDDIQFTG